MSRTRVWTAAVSSMPSGSANRAGPRRFAGNAMLPAAILCLAVAIVAAGCAGRTPGASKPSAERRSGPNAIYGYVLVTDPDAAWTVNASCTPTGQLKDLVAGTEVVVTDGPGKVIGDATLPAGVGEEDDATDHEGSDTHVCEFPFVVPGLVTTETYAVRVGDRPAKTVQLGELKALFWQLFFQFPGPAPS